MWAAKTPLTTSAHQFTINQFKELEMTSGFNNFNSNIGNQVIGTLNVGFAREGELAFIQQQLDTIFERLKSDAADTNSEAKNALLAIEEIRKELASKSPNASIVDQSLRAIDSISSVSSLVAQIRALLTGLF
jgi:hypothetical protein